MILYQEGLLFLSTLYDKLLAQNERSKDLDIKMPFHIFTMYSITLRTLYNLTYKSMRNVICTA